MRERLIALVLLMGSSSAALAQDAPGKTVLDKTRERSKTELEVVQQKTQVLVVSGHFDNVENVLDGLNIKYDAVTPEEFLQKDLTPYVAVLINCYGEMTQKGDEAGPPKGRLPIVGMYRAPKNIAKGLSDKVRKYVEKGGYLFTSDWAAGLTAAAFPEYLKTMKNSGKQDETFPVHPYKKDENHPFLKDVFSYGDKGGGTGTEKKIATAQWAVEAYGVLFDIAPSGKSKVKVLMVSEQLEKKYGSPLVAVTFAMKGGMPTGGKKRPEGAVLHVLGHFYQQGLGNKDNDEVAKMYQLIVNFVLEAQKNANLTGAK